MTFDAAVEISVEATLGVGKLETGVDTKAVPTEARKVLSSKDAFPQD